MAFLELKNVYKSYKCASSRTDGLCDVNLQIEKGEFVAIPGYSGAGKSMLLSLIAGRTIPDSGSITLNGISITGPSPDCALFLDDMGMRVALSQTPQILLVSERLETLNTLARIAAQDEIQRIWSESHATVILITNDVDEGILLADRIIPLGSGPCATLGPSIPIALPRPRDRRELKARGRFQEIRNQVINFLLGTHATFN